MTVQPDRHVPSSAPGTGPRDLSADLARHRARPAGPTEPPGGYPTTVGMNPDPPEQRLASPDDTNDVAAPGPYDSATQFIAGRANY